METHFQRIQEFASKRLKPTSATANFLDVIRSTTHGNIVHTNDLIQVGPSIFRFVDAQSAALMCKYIESYFAIARANTSVQCEE